MTTLYLKEQGAVLRRTGERLVVTKEKEVLQDLPIIHVEQVVVMGNVQLTTPAVALLLQKDVDVVFLSSRGKFRGRLVTTGSRFARLRHAQLQLLEQPEAVLAVARAVVVGKLANQMALLEGAGAQRAVASIGQARAKAARAPNVDTLRGYEGTAGAVYFGALRAMIPGEWGFERRIYHPPPDPVNALLSLGYTLLLKDVTAAVQLVGLDPYLGFFHALDYGRPSLCLDLMEPFRPVVDRLVLGLIAESRVARDDFRPSRKNGKETVLLKDPALKRYLKAYERAVQARVYAPQSDSHTSIRRSMELQARAVARVILRRQGSFRPFRMT